MKNRIAYNVTCDEKKIRETIDVSMSAFLIGELESSVPFAEFLYGQIRYIKKAWWLIQGILLAVLYFVLCNVNSDLHIRRSMGIAAPLFVVLIVPEIWKNRSCGAMEVEGTTFYTIRQIYAARLTLFAGVDLLLLTMFFLSVSFLSRITLWDIMLQFVLPFNVTCCICLRSLYGLGNYSESFSVLMCSVWTGLWVLIVLNDAVYNAISVSTWGVLLMLSFVFLGYSVYKGQKTIYKTWEVIPSWN